MKGGKTKVDHDAKKPRSSPKRALKLSKGGGKPKPGVKTNWPYTTPPGRSANIKGC